ncbi:phosphotransferase [Priestia koreensis]|uniref:phosphotransferase n=1 Tax=Priestia koreensis TaxID=284581 RepID=UPI003459E5F1
MTKIKLFDQGEDLIQNRLLLFSLQQAGIEPRAYKRIKENVYIIETTMGYKVLKGYELQQKAHVLFNVLERIHQEGFSSLAYFERFPNKATTIACEKYCWMMMPYYPSCPIMYKSLKDRRDVTHLLNAFHHVGGTLHSEFQDVLPTQFIMDKWSKRFLQFQRSVSHLRLFLSPKELHQLCHWSEQSLYLMENYQTHQNKTLTIVHGDVASHNFLRINEGKMCLIDFDLALISSSDYDELQLAHRFLRYVDWSLDSIFDHFPSWKTNPFYVAALLFPTDLLREWNQISAGEYTPARIQALQAHTKWEVYYRLNLAEDLLYHLASS